MTWLDLEMPNIYFLLTSRLPRLKDGQEQEAIVDLFDYYDEATGFTAMERTTGWHAAIMAGFMARRQTPLGGVPVELAVPGQVFVEEFHKRGFDLRVLL